MKIGDLVRRTTGRPGEAGIVVDIYMHKLWRADKLGKKVDFSKIDPEPFAKVMIGDAVVGIPQEYLEVIDESR